MSNFTKELENINRQVDELVSIYNKKQNAAESLSKEHLKQIQQIQNKLNPLGSIPDENSKSQQSNSFFSLLNPFKPRTNGGKYSQKRKSVKRRSTKKGGRKHK